MKVFRSFENYLKNSVRLLWWYFKTNKIGFVIFFISILLVTLIPLYNAYIFKIIVDDIISALDTDSSLPSNMKLNMILFASTLLANTVGWRISEFVNRILYLNFKLDVEMKYHKKVSDLNFAHFSYPDTNNLLNKVNENYSWRLPDFATRQMYMLQNIIDIFSISIIILAYKPIIFIGIVLSALPEFLIRMKYGKDVWGIYGAKGDVKRYFWITSDYLRDERYLEEIQIYKTRNYLLSKMKVLYRDFLDAQLGKEKSKFSLSLMSTFFSGFFYIACSLYLIFATFNKVISVGTLYFYYGRISKLLDSFAALFRNLGSNYDDLLYVDDYFKVMKLKNKIKSSKKLLNIDPKAYKIEFKNVSFKYPKAKQWILRNFNLVINEKEKIAIIGSNGAGKTTIIRLLCRLYDPNEGQILINGIDLKNINYSSWKNCIGVLFQAFNKYSYSVLENIQLGDVDKPFERKIFDLSLKKSDAYKFIHEYKDQEKTILSKQFEGGIDPSIGQWQKVALARAFFRDAPILILDEPTSAIDAKAEAEIFDQLEKFEKNKTVIMISHRFSTVRKADKIYVVEKGKIVESGNHEDLMKLGGRYEEMFSVQAKGYK